MKRSRFSLLGLTAAAVAAAGPGVARAGSPAVTVAISDTTDFWQNVSGGIARGGTTLNKLQASIMVDGQGAGLPGLHLYAQVFKTNDESLSLARTGDVQTASNIEAPGSARLHELWVEKAHGQDGLAGWTLLRVGVIDLNRTFDSISTAGLFLNSSHGIGPDLSKSGLGDPSIFPATAPAVQVAWRPVRSLALNAGAFAEPDPSHLLRFADLSIRHGVLLIGQADWTPSKTAQVSVAVWRYSSRQPSLADPTRTLAPRPGAYAFAQGQTGLPGTPQAWVRVGAADGRVQVVSAYAGGGLVWSGPGSRRDKDQFGVAVAHAEISRTARRVQGLPAGETTIEASYSYAVNGYLSLQPDIQEIFSPAAAPGLRDATVLGLRIKLSAQRTRGGD
jgi:porin